MHAQSEAIAEDCGSGTPSSAGWIYLICSVRADEFGHERLLFSGCLLQVMDARDRSCRCVPGVANPATLSQLQTQNTLRRLSMTNLISEFQQL